MNTLQAYILRITRRLVTKAAQTESNWAVNIKQSHIHFCRFFLINSIYDRLLWAHELGCAQCYPKRETSIWELNKWIRGWETRQPGSTSSCTRGFTKRLSNIILTTTGEEPPKAKRTRLEILRAVKFNGFNWIFEHIYILQLLVSFFDYKKLSERSKFDLKEICKEKLSEFIIFQTKVLTLMDVNWNTHKNMLVCIKLNKATIEKA